MLASMLGFAASKLVAREPLYHALSRDFLRPLAGSADPPSATEQKP